MSDVEDALARALSAETAIVAPARSERARFLRFLMTGGCAAAVNISARCLLGFFLRYEIAIAVAYLIGMTTAFALARQYVFDATKNGVRRQYLRFALVNAVAFAQVWVVSVALARFVLPSIGWVWQAQTIAHVIGVGSPVLTSYVGHRWFSFR